MTGTAGWGTTVKTVRAIDEDKIRDCKEDIDTLLVFAGLFSAVMTAFLIESYQLLDEDPSDVVTRLLERLVDQTESYQLVNGSLYSRAGPRAKSPPFSPPPSAIHVNVLWFASLMFSLITASYGMLVKQWLR
ncbi:uncharacterized protein PHACADRAFT_85211, partial [Phanerochaete carnosa HHB-10118-sp]